MTGRRTTAVRTCGDPVADEEEGVPEAEWGEHVTDEEYRARPPAG
ncbi:hypothetical protein [Streptosporangium sp. NPDC023615]